MRTTLTVTLMVALTAFAGCLGDDAPVDSADLDDDAGRESASRVVVADVDTGINPYHVAFRDDGPDAFRHPSEYLDGFPADTPALNLTLDAADYAAAVTADCAVWEAVETGQLYWIPGTRIVGAMTFEEADATCDPENDTTRILDYGGHGTMTASRVAGDGYSLCPDCKIAFLQGFTSDAMLWASEQPYIDLQTNSWGDLPHSWLAQQGGQCGDEGQGQCNNRDDVLRAASLHPVFVAGGNGLAGFFGVSGHPAYFDNVAGPGGIIMVGGHDNGYYTPWTMTLPHIVADANQHPSATTFSIDERDETGGGGTSGATPFAAGTMAAMLMAARDMVCDHGTGVRDGNLVMAAPDCDRPLPTDGPLADGFLSVEEARNVLFHTANARPVEDGIWDGPHCGQPVCGNLYPTTPLSWNDAPGAAPLFYFVGYGQVGNVTLPDAVAVLAGDMAEPARPSEDQFFAADNAARQLLDG